MIAGGLAVILALAAILSLPIGAQRKPSPHPRLANLFLKWHLSEEDARDLARWDVLILDMEVARNTPGAFARLREANPDAVLLAYVTAQEIRRDAAVHPQSALRRALAARVSDAWYLRSATGERVSWWPQTWLLDMTNRAWTDALAAFIAEEIASDSRWDGVYFDNLWGGVSWLPNASLDLDRDGRPEDAATLDARWEAGTRALLTATRARIPRAFLITGNGDAKYAALTNGLLFEHFPTTPNEWSAAMRAYARVLEDAMDPVLAMINVNTRNTGVQDPQRFRFGFASTLLGGGYYSFDFGDLDHAQRWWFDAYDLALGNPIGTAERITDVRNASVARAAVESDSRYAPGVYRRDYASGVVLVNATSVEQRVRFDEEFELALGADMDRGVAHPIVSEVTIPPSDGVVLLRPIAGIRDAVFRNGTFARVFRSDGRTARNGFFAFDDRARGGMTVERHDLDGDGNPEAIIADGAMVRVLRDGQETHAFAPFGTAYSGALDFAVADLDRNGTWEIAVATRDRQGFLGIFNLLEGRLLTPLSTPFGRGWTHGMSIAVLPSDGVLARPAIAVGAGAGAAPEVRILDSRGRFGGTRFLAYDARFRGGVEVAGGDVDGDGAGEIVTGAGSGGGPHVRVFDLAGKLRSEFFAFASHRRGGVDVAVTDLDGNGVMEILGMSTSVFTRDE